MKKYFFNIFWNHLFFTVIFISNVSIAFAQHLHLKKKGANYGDLKSRIDSNTTRLDTSFFLNRDLENLMQDELIGLTILRESGDPGQAKSLFVRGLSVPLGLPSSRFENQPLYILNGIPLLNNDNPYSLASNDGLKNEIGSGINITSLQNMDNIESIELLNASEAFAKYGYLAANGIIYIHTKRPVVGGYHIDLNTYVGIGMKNSAFYKNNFIAVNGAYDRHLIQSLENKYKSDAMEPYTVPSFILDSTNRAYFGAADWADRYYKNAVQHGLSLSISGGNEMASFRFGAAEKTESGIAEDASLKSYSSFFDMNINPNSKLFVRTYVQAGLGTRIRSYSIRDRFKDMNRLPSSIAPLPSSKYNLDKYYGLLEGQVDDNSTTSLQVSLHAEYKIMKNLRVKSDFNMDYNDNIRELFIPSMLANGSSYNSYFTGVNRRVSTNNYVHYQSDSKNGQVFKVQIGQSWMSDRLKYDQLNADRGPSDFVKIIGEGTTHDDAFVYRKKDFLSHDMLSFYGNVDYFYKDNFQFSLGVRNDGSSYFGNGNKWRLSPSSNLVINVFDANRKRSNSSFFNSLKLMLSASQIGRFLTSDMLGYGPYYTVDLGGSDRNLISSYLSIPTLNFPYSQSYVNGRMKMPYNNEFSGSLVFQVLNSLNGKFTYYRRESKDLVVDVPVDASYGFTHKKMNGMNIRNSGVEISLSQNYVLSDKLSWNYSISAQYNRNTLMGLPGALKSLQYGNAYLEVGKSVDKFLVFENQGIYLEDKDIPRSPSGKKLSFKGIELNAGDPNWVNKNSDDVIDDRDKVLKGNKIPPFKATYFNSVQYKKIVLDFILHISLGNSILNGGLTSRLDGLSSTEKGFDNLKDISYWLAKKDFNNYPTYNPWSEVRPYRVEQDLFLESGNYIKLESLALRYNLSDISAFKKIKLKKAQVYITADNLFRISPYSGMFPELSGIDGYDSGYRYPLPITFSFGFKTSI